MNQNAVGRCSRVFASLRICVCVCMCGGTTKGNNARTLDTDFACASPTYFPETMFVENGSASVTLSLHVTPSSAPHLEKASDLSC